MDFNKVMQMAGFKQSNETEFSNFWFTKIENLYFAAKRLNDSENEVVQLSIVFAQVERKGDIINFLDDEKSLKHVSSYQINDDSLFIDYNLEEFSESLATFMDNLTKVLKNLGLSNCCVHCGNTENLHLHDNVGRPCVLCDDCSSKIISQINSEKNANTNYLKGFLFSLLGAIAGSFIWILLGAIGWISSFAGYAIAFAAFWAYSKAKGKLTKTGVIINIVTIVLSLLLAEIVGIIIQIYKEIPGLELFDYIVYLFYILRNFDFLKHELINLGIGALFAFLGCNQIIKSNLNAAKNMQNMSIVKLD